MKGSFVDFRAIKDQISIEDVLAHYRIRLRSVSRTSVRGHCPLPTHSSKKSIQSFSVDTEKGVWACQSDSCVAARYGKVGGTVLDFVSVMERCSIREAALKLQAWFPLSSLPGISTQVEAVRPATGPAVGRSVEHRKNTPLPFTLSGIDPGHLFLRQRGIRIETARHFGVGFFPGRGLMAGRIVIPIHDEAGKLVAYAGRSIDGTEPKYRFPKGFVKSAVLFNLHRVSSNEVIIVEGFFDCLNVWQAGYRNVLALMGSSLSARQEELLRRIERFVLFLDGDAPGRQATRAITARLATSHIVRVVELAERRQPDQLSVEELRALLQF